MHQHLNEFDPRLEATLWSGTLNTNEGEKLAILKSIEKSMELGQPKQYHFELKDKKTLEIPSLLKRLMLSTRPFSLTATATPGLVVLGSGMIIEGLKPNLTSFVLSLLAVVFLQASTNVMNDVYDHLKGIDFPGDIGGSGVIQKGWLSAKSLFIFALVLCAGALALGALPLLLSWKSVGWIGALGLAGGLGYSGLGIGLKYRALGDLIVLILCGPALTFGFSLVTFGTHGTSGASMSYTGLILGLAAVGILHANNLNDLEVDHQRGARTVANLIGFKYSQKYFSWIYFAILGISVLGALTKQVPFWFSLAPLLVGPLILKAVNQVKRASGPLSPSIALIRFEAAKIHLLFGISLLFALMVDWALKSV